MALARTSEDLLTDGTDSKDTSCGRCVKTEQDIPDVFLLHTWADGPRVEDKPHRAGYHGNVAHEKYRSREIG